MIVGYYIKWNGGWIETTRDHYMRPEMINHRKMVYTLEPHPPTRDCDCHECLPSFQEDE